MPATQCHQPSMQHSHHQHVHMLATTAPTELHQQRLPRTYTFKDIYEFESTPSTVSEGTFSPYACVRSNAWLAVRISARLVRIRAWRSGRLRFTLAAAAVLFPHAVVTAVKRGIKDKYTRVPKFWTHGSVCCACAQRPGMPRGCHSG